MIVEQGLLDREFHATGSAREAVDQARAGGGVAWVIVRDAADGEVEPILHLLGLDRRILLVANRRRGHAGVIALQGHLLVSLITLDETADDLAPIDVQALVGPDHVVTLLSGGAAAATDLRHHVQERLGELTPGSPPTGMATLVALLLEYFDRYDHILDRLDDTIQALAERLFPQPDDTILADTYRTSQRLLRVGRAVRPLAHGLSEAAADEHIAGEAALHQAMVRLRTVAEALAERVTWAEQTLSSLSDTILGLISQRSNDLAARQSVVARRISAYALLFAIPNAVFALYGTNFEHLPPLLTRSYGYPLLLALTAVLMAVAAWRLRRSGWL